MWSTIRTRRPNELSLDENAWDRVLTKIYMVRTTRNIKVVSESSSVTFDKEVYRRQAVCALFATKIGHLQVVGRRWLFH
jgi:hypothetical protein